MYDSILYIKCKPLRIDFTFVAIEADLGMHVAQSANELLPVGVGLRVQQHEWHKRSNSALSLV